VELVAEAEHALLGAALLLVTPCAAERGVVFACVQGLLQRLGLHDVRVALGAVRERPDAFVDAVLVDPLDEVQVEVLHQLVTELDHLAELPRGVHVEDLERDLGRRERLLGEAQHDSGVLADGVEHHGPLELRGDLTDDVDALLLQLLQVAEGVVAHDTVGGSLRKPRCFNMSWTAAAHSSSDSSPVFRWTAGDSGGS